MATRAARLLLLCGLSAGAAGGAPAPVPVPVGDAVALVQGVAAVSAEHLRSGREGEESVLLGAGESSAQALLAPAGGASAGLSAAEADLRERAGRLAAAKLKALEEEDYDLAKRLKREAGALQAEGGVERLRALKRAAVEEEDFDLAKDLKQRIRILEGSGSDLGMADGRADKVKAYYNAGHEPLPWGWRSARDPDSGLEYYWPVNDRSAVTWDSPRAPAASVQAPARAPSAAVRTTTPPPPFEVRSANGAWSRCRLVGNGTKPGTYDITVGGGVQLSNIPGVAIRNATDQAPLLTNETYQAALAAARALLPKPGDLMEVRTKSGRWAPCLVTGQGNESEAYNVHVPSASAGHQNHSNVHISILRRVANAGTASSQAGNSSNSTRAEAMAEAAPHLQA